MGVSIKAKDMDNCVEALNAGGLAVVPTDTVYGLVCRAQDETAVAKLYALKNRAQKPGTVIAGSIDQLVDLGIKRRYLTAVEQYWPNPISIEIPHDLAYLSQNTGRQAFRIVADDTIKELLDKTGPLLTSSANMPGEDPAENIEQARQYFDDEVGFYLDGGDISNISPSTLIRIVDDAVEVLREGAVKINERGEIEK